MRVCLDTNVLLQLFTPAQHFRPIKEALTAGLLELAVSNEILLEYEEVVTHHSGARRWLQITKVFARLFQVHASILFIEPHFRFQVIATDPDDNKFVDCAIAAQADFIITEDHDFDPLITAPYKPKPIAPLDFINRYLIQRT